MKKLFRAVLLAAVVLFAGNAAHAQSKIGYINFRSVVETLPEAKGVQTQLETYQKQFTDQLTAMNNEYTTKVADYQKTQSTMTDAARAVKANEIQDIQKRMQEYNNTAQQQVSAKVNELSKPLVEKARGAVNAVAKEKGYTYVFDTSQVDLIVSPEGDDLMPAVKAKLGIK